MISFEDHNKISSFLKEKAFDWGDMKKIHESKKGMK